MIGIPVNEGDRQTSNETEKQLSENQRLPVKQTSHYYQKHHKEKSTQEMVALQVVAKSGHFQISLQTSVGDNNAWIVQREPHSICLLKGTLSDNQIQNKQKPHLKHTRIALFPLRELTQKRPEGETQCSPRSISR